MKIGVIGAGHRGRNAYARLLRNYEDVEIVSFVDTDLERLKSSQDEFGINNEYIFDNSDDFFEKMDEDKFVDAWLQQHMTGNTMTSL